MDYDFDPKKVGFIFDEEYKAVEHIFRLLCTFDAASPNPGHIGEFVAGIILDGISFFQVKEELKRESAGRFVAEHIEFERCGTLFGFPISISGFEGIGLAMKTSLAPTMLRGQILELQQADETRDFLDRAVEQIEEEVAPPLVTRVKGPETMQ